jgi:hypothetical protein
MYDFLKMQALSSFERGTAKCALRRFYATASFFTLLFARRF